MTKEIKVLDKGFVRLISTEGDDAAIVAAARVSYASGTKSVRTDRGLIRYLMRHQHLTPFEMAGIKLHIKAPIFVARQNFRHRTWSYNEVSARYSVLPDEMYVPELNQVCLQATDNKQGRGAVLPDGVAIAIRNSLIEQNQTAYQLYTSLLSQGLARETARAVLPLSTYTEFYGKVDLRNLLGFLKLRTDPHAQYEIRVYADAIASIVEEWVPYTYEAYRDYWKDSVTFSTHEIAFLRSLIGYSDKDEYDSLIQHFDQKNMISSRERKDLYKTLFGIAYD